MRYRFENVFKRPAGMVKFATVIQRRHEFFGSPCCPFSQGVHSVAFVVLVLT